MGLDPSKFAIWRDRGVVKNGPPACQPGLESRGREKKWIFENLKFELGGSGCRGWIRIEELVWTLLGR